MQSWPSARVAKYINNFWVLGGEELGEQNLIP